MRIGPQLVYAGRSGGLVTRVGQRLRAGATRLGSDGAATVRWSEVIADVRWEGSARGRQFFVITAARSPEDELLFTLTHRPDLRAGVIDIRSHPPTRTLTEAMALAESLARVELARRRA